MNCEIKLDDVVREPEVLGLYSANHWSAADKAAQLMAALLNSHGLVTARAEGRLIGLGNAISDGHLVLFITRTCWYTPTGSGAVSGKK